MNSLLKLNLTIEEIYDLISENVDLDEVLPKPMVIIWDEIGELIQENEILSDKNKIKI